MENKVSTGREPGIEKRKRGDSWLVLIRIVENKAKSFALKAHTGFRKYTNAEFNIADVVEPCLHDCNACVTEPCIVLAGKTSKRIEEIQHALRELFVQKFTSGSSMYSDLRYRSRDLIGANTFQRQRHRGMPYGIGRKTKHFLNSLRIGGKAYSFVKQIAPA